MRFRISGGSVKGRFITVPAVSGLRPTTEANRQSIFNILGDIIADSRVADLFSGTGLLGFESMSRGASSVLFVEKNPLLAKLLRDNASLLGFGSSTEVVNDDVARKSWQVNKTAAFDIVMADPPYGAGANLLGLAENLLKNNGLFVFESSSREEINEVQGTFFLEKVRKKGDTMFTIYRKGGDK